MKIIGITGNIGSGKTSVVKLFEKYNCKIIDLDKLGHEILQDEKYREKVVKVFGVRILDHNQISRPKLRKIVFFNKKNLLLLNKIVHPELIRRLKQTIKNNKDKKYTALVIDGALIYELKVQDLISTIITIDTHKIISYLRLKNISYREFNFIYSGQLPVKIKKEKADYVINNNLSFSFTQRKVEEIINKIL